jgi:hypothetical protein
VKGAFVGRLDSSSKAKRMRLHTPLGSRVRRSLLVVTALAVAAISCAREVTAPNRGFLRMSRGISFLTRFPEALRDNAPGTSGLVDVAKVRVVLYRADSTIALDTMVAFPDGQDSVSISMSVPLSPTAPASGESLNMGLKYVSTTGDTVFKGAAPVTATAVTGTSTTTTQTPATVTVTVVYTGTGSSAKSVVASPRTQQVFIGQNFTWSGVAKDAAGSIIANTPIKWSSLDPDIASITNASTGVGIANKRGTARIVGELLTGPKDTVLLTVLAASSSIALQSGNNQSGTVGQKLAQPIVAQVLGTDGAPVSGRTVTVTFGTGTNATTLQATSDANGLASADWTLGTVAGPQTATITATGLTGSPVTFTANALPGAATALSAGTVATSIVAGTSLAPVTFTARDNFGNTATAFTGTVTVALGGSATASLLGTKTATAIGGVATFSGLGVNTVGTGYTLSATAPNLTATTSAAFAVTPAAAASLQFAAPLASSVTADNPVPVFSVNALDPFGNLATGFTGAVTLAVSGTSATGTALSGTTSVAAIAGVARFDGTRLQRAGTGYQITAASGGLTTATSSAFAITPGVPANCAPTTVQNQSYFVGAVLPLAPSVRVSDAYGNTIANNTVTFATTGGGIVGTPSRPTDATGTATSSWTLGSTSGTQSLTATCTGVSAPTTFAANAQPLGIKLNAGSSPSVPTGTVAVGQQIAIPIVLDLSFPNGDNVASVSFDIQYDSTRFSLVSTAGGTFGSFFENTSAAASAGKISVGVFSPTAATATTTVYQLTLLAKPGFANSTSTVTLVVTAAGRENATNVVVLPRNLSISITP